MARNEADREDLFAEATAYPWRGEVAVQGFSEPIFAGQRADGRFSFYFGGDPVYHFDADGLLRRAFVAGDLYRSQGTTLACLKRRREPSCTVLERGDLTEPQLRFFRDAMRDQLTVLTCSLPTRLTVLRATAEDDDFQTRLLSLVQLAISQAYQLAPRIPGKR